jgi:hypothetical protein
MDDIDVWHAARHFMKVYGADASVITAMRADALLDLGDGEGFHVWQRIVTAVRDLERTALRPGETMH